MSVIDQVRIAVVLTAVPAEFQAVREHLVEVEERFHPAGTAFYVGYLSNGRRRVALAQIDSGNDGAAALGERAISFFRPELLVFVGVAGGLMRDIALGDIVVPPHIHAYHGGLENDDGFHARPRGWPISHRLVQFAQHIARHDGWLAALPERPGDRPKVHFRPIAAGEVVLNSLDSPIARLIRRHYNDAAAIEMESAGLARASHLNDSLPAIAIRGISDTVAGDKYATDRAGWQPRAARHAAAFAITLLSELPPQKTAESPAGQVIMPVAVRPTAPRPQRWGGGADVRVGASSYLLVGDDLLEERPAGDGSITFRQARGLQLVPRPPSSAAHVWIRQAQARPDISPVPTALDALAAEREQLAALPAVPGLPTLVQFHRDECTATLVYRWPVSRSAGAPCETLHPVSGEPPALDRWRMRRLFAGLAALCVALATLHDRQLAHRRLAPAGLVELDDGTLVLRDLGLAAVDYRPGEAPGDYQAPEQSRRSPHRSGPWTDVYRLGAIVYHLTTGHLPNPVNPLPLSHHRPDLPQPCGQTVDAALAPDPAGRPDVRGLGRVFRAVGRELA